MRKNALVIHSGGMDSSICLALAIKEFGKENVLSLSFAYGQRHLPEIQQAKKICRIWDVDHTTVNLECLNEITDNALMNRNVDIAHEKGKPPNTLVVGRNGLMAHLGGIHAHHMGAHCIYMGVMELEGANSGYRDCSRHYMDLQQHILRIDLDSSGFEIRTPLIRMTKKETMRLADQMGILDFLLKETITCYEGVPHQGCRRCPACHLRNEGIQLFSQENPQFNCPYLLNSP
jgi:7-cyano-7-deazaguanine synthase